MTDPSPTPQEKALRRVLTVSRLDGWSVIVIAALGTLLTLAFGDLLGCFVGVMIAAAGGLELRGRRKLERRDAAGMKMLVRSQMFLLTVILVYCASRLGSFDADSAMGNLTPDMEAMLKEAGIVKADILPMVRLAFFGTYGTVALVSLLFQGGMAFFYRRKTPLVTAALAAPPRARVSHLPPSI
jgi:hypothetical protein